MHDAVRGLVPDDRAVWVVEQTVRHDPRGAELGARSSIHVDLVPGEVQEVLVHVAHTSGSAHVRGDPSDHRWRYDGDDEPGREVPDRCRMPFVVELRNDPLPIDPPARVHQRQDRADHRRVTDLHRVRRHDNDAPREGRCHDREVIEVGRVTRPHHEAQSLPSVHDADERIERWLDEAQGLETGYAAEFARPPVTLTIDAGAQHALEEELSLAMAQYGASGAAGVILDAESGAVRAAASLPDVDPGRPGAAIAGLGKRIERPKAILVASAHWLTNIPAISNAEKPETIHDFYGFPDELYRLSYPAPGAPDLATRAVGLLNAAGIRSGMAEYGLDHGAWSPLLYMYPQADVPVVQVALQTHLGARHHIEVGRALAPLDLLINSWRGFLSARESYGRLDALLASAPSRDVPMPLPAPLGELSVEKLVVVPPGAPGPVIKGISLLVEAGTLLAVIGPSAAGK